MSNVGGQPVAIIIEVFHFSGAIGKSGPNYQLLVANSMLNPVLNSGTNYWFIAFVPTDERAGWNRSSRAVTRIKAQRLSTGTGNNSLTTQNAFRVSGSVVPELSTVFLLSVGFSGLFCYGWRKKQKN